MAFVAHVRCIRENGTPVEAQLQRPQLAMLLGESTHSWAMVPSCRTFELLDRASCGRSRGRRGSIRALISQLVWVRRGKLTAHDVARC